MTTTPTITPDIVKAYVKRFSEVVTYDDVNGTAHDTPIEHQAGGTWELLRLLQDIANQKNGASVLDPAGYPGLFPLIELVTGPVELPEPAPDPDRFIWRCQIGLRLEDSIRFEWTDALKLLVDANTAKNWLDLGKGTVDNMRFQVVNTETLVPYHSPLTVNGWQKHELAKFEEWQARQ